MNRAMNPDELFGAWTCNVFSIPAVSCARICPRACLPGCLGQLRRRELQEVRQILSGGIPLRLSCVASPPRSRKIPPHILKPILTPIATFTTVRPTTTNELYFFLC